MKPILIGAAALTYATLLTGIAWLGVGREIARRIRHTQWVRA